MSKPSVSVRIDWARISVPVDVEPHVTQLLSAIFGQTESRGGRWMLSDSEHWTGVSAFVLTDPEKDYAIIDLPAQAVSLIGEDRMIELLMFCMSHGGHLTRFDVAVDFKGGQASALVDQVAASCMAQELTGARVFRLHNDYSRASRVSHGVSIGNRGKNGSGRFVRVYDKGLERNQKAGGSYCEGEYVRWELEASGDCAQEYAAAYCRSDSERERAGFALSAIEFRNANGAKHRARRPLVSWYASLCEWVGSAARFTRVRAVPSIESWCQWAGRSFVAPVRRFAEDHGVSFTDAVDLLLGSVPAGGSQTSRALQTAAAWLKHAPAGEGLSWFRATDRRADVLGC